MLVLSRKIGESIIIGEGVVVKVLEVKGRYVRLGMEAPASVSIRRPDAGKGPPRGRVASRNRPGTARRLRGVGPSTV